MDRQFTEELLTLEEEYELQRIEALPEEQQRLVYLHYLDQFEAVPSYLEQQAAQFAREEY
jgi:hypothetical protein